MNPNNVENYLRLITKLFAGWILRYRYSITLITLLGTISITIYTINTTNSDLRDFPFIAQVWGDAASWISLGISIGTIILLYRTFQNQLMVQKYQQAQASIELDVHIDKIKPCLKEREFGATPFSFNSENRTFIMEIEGHLENIGKDAYDVTWESKSEIRGLGDIGNGKKGDGIKVFGESSVKSFNIMASGLELPANNQVKYNIKFYYKDRLKNEYEQLLVFSFVVIFDEVNGNRPTIDKEVKSHSPKLIKPYLPI